MYAVQECVLVPGAGQLTTGDNILYERVKYLSSFRWVNSLIVRSADSMDANYIETDKSYTKKEFLRRIKIRRKIAEESRY